MKLRIYITLCMLVLLVLIIGGMTNISLKWTEIEHRNDEIRMSKALINILAHTIENDLKAKNYHSIRQTLNSLTAAEGDFYFLYITAPDNKIIVHTFPHEAPKGLPELPLSPTGSDGLPIPFFDNEHRKVYPIVSPIPNTDGAILFAGFKGENFEKGRDTLGKPVILMSFIFLMVGAIVSLIISSHITSVVRRITSLLEMKQSDLEHEIGARSLLERQLCDANDDLEARVKHRTIELEEALATLEETQHQIVQQERLRALGTMASGIAHDFNNALSPILGFSEMLLADPDGLDDKKTVRQFLELINLAGKDAAHIVGRLREFYRHQEKVKLFQPIALNKLIEQVENFTKPRWKVQAQAQGVQIDFMTDLSDIPNIEGNESELREVLINLIFNAVDTIIQKAKARAQPDQPFFGAINIRTFTSESKKSSSGSVSSGISRRVGLEVKDTGQGMSETTLSKCLDPFFSTKGTKGTGLGLTMVQSIIQRHNGTISISSQENKGTTFVISLPVCYKTAPKLAIIDESSVYPSQKILIVDNDHHMIEILTRFLVIDGNQVEAAVNGFEGLEKFKEKKFDLVITDRTMPEMNGYQLAKAIKQEHPETPIILITGFTEEVETAEKTSEVIDQIVCKPFTHPAIRSAILKVLKKNQENI